MPEKTKKVARKEAKQKAIETKGLSPAKPRETKGALENRALPLVKSTYDTAGLSAIAAGLVHEIKNPLASLHLHLQLLQTQILEVDNIQLRDKLQKKIELIQSEISNLNTTLYSFFKLFKPDAKIKASKPIALHPLIEEVIQLLEPQAKKRNIQMRHPHTHKSNPKLIPSWDRGFLRQILINLVLNAIQAFPNPTEVQPSVPYPKSDALNIDLLSPEDAHSNLGTNARKITICSKDGPQNISIAVQDNGLGIDSDTQKKIFDAFYTQRQSNQNSKSNQDNANWESEKGTGLGLTLVKELLAAMDSNASLEVKSKLGAGSTFIVHLPKKDLGVPLLAQSTHATEPN